MISVCEQKKAVSTFSMPVDRAPELTFDTMDVEWRSTGRYSACLSASSESILVVSARTQMLEWRIEPGVSAVYGS